MRNIFLATVAILALLAVSAFAGDYHRTTTLICADCHIMHASQSHGYGTNGSGTWTPYTSTPNHYLLRQADINDLCLQCHDGQTSAPDVFENQTNGSDPRGAGALNHVGSTGTWAEEYGHSLGSTATAPGGTFASTEGLECTNCHGAHGSAGWRNLGPFGTTMPQLTYAVGGATADYTKDVWERAAHVYNQDNCDFPKVTATPTESKYGQMCKFCHTNFHGTSTSANMNDGAEWLRHPTADATYAASATGTFGTALYRPKVMMAAGEDWGTQGTALAAARNITPSCFTCHKGHGNNNPFGLVYTMYGTTATAPTENGNGTKIKNTCNHCHGMGRE